MDREPYPTGPDVLEHGAGRDDRPGRPWLRWLALALAAVVALVLVVRAERRDPGPPAAERSTAAPSTAATSASAVGPVGSGPAVTELGHPLFGGTAGWELFGRGPDAVVRIEPAPGRVSVTAVPGLASGGPVSFLAGPGRVVIRPLDRVPGYAVPDGRPAQALTGALAEEGPLIPGPEPGTGWLTREHRYELVGLDGQARNVALDQPTLDGGGFVEPDGAGYPLFTGTGGSYSVRPDGIRRLTSGAVLAVGRTRALARECDERYRCATVVVDRRTGARRPLPGRLPSALQVGGSVSPDGNRAALLVEQPPLRPMVHLIDLNTGADRPLDARIESASFDESQYAWSPDGRFLFLLDADGELHATETNSGRSGKVDLGLPRLTQLAVRSR
ncbi:hypothetical protein ACFFWC_00355 [Plantactinospora siamensis]|uniref:Dipeptidylpeptidase IV N-terminal domain-containing protein n=1 Tax=Plantactinospora siamensis TaxID=555372 RepID=A0ABV6NTS7_9ACTN